MSTFNSQELNNVCATYPGFGLVSQVNHRGFVIRQVMRQVRMPRTPFSTTVRVVKVQGRYLRAQLRILADLARWQKKESPTLMSLKGYFSRRLRAGGGMFLSIFGRMSSLSSDILGPFWLEIAARQNHSVETGVVVLVRELEIKRSYRTSRGKDRMSQQSHGWQ